MALGKGVYDDLSGMETFQLVIARFQVALLVVHVGDEEIEAWKR